MNILLIGAGVIGTVYGAELAAGGHTVSVYDHGKRTEQIKRSGLIVKDLATGVLLQQPVKIVSDPKTAAYDLVLVAVRQDQLVSVFPIVKQLKGEPTLLFFGNNPNGRSVLPKDLSKVIELGFPGLGGLMVGDTVEYLRISQQPTAIQANASSPTQEFAQALRLRGFKVESVADMDGWLVYHAVFVASIAAALYRCGTNATRLSGDRTTLALMCQAIEEGFEALRVQGIHGEPRNLHILHMPWLRPFAIRYWSRTFRSPMGELSFAAHARHAQAEMQALAKAVLSATAASPTRRDHLQQLLQ
jgi:2-dehydropantoate 2-reductase